MSGTGIHFSGMDQFFSYKASHACHFFDEWNLEAVKKPTSAVPNYTIYHRSILMGWRACEESHRTDAEG
ncbi:MAG TPA: hypothetical protein VE422_48920 [Terriglobia bacterium]|nr:hypothetical protein [Terriglobia bacterium]